MSEALLVVDGLRVEYEDVTAVDDVSFTLEAGMVYGLIGPNGAGKTSIMRAVAGLLEPTWGRIQVCGVDMLLEPREGLQHLGYMPDFPPLYEDLTVYEFLELFASAYGIPKSAREARIRLLVDQVKLTDKLLSNTGGLSRGMKQRLFLARTLIHDPAVLLLDEPASGLDPRARLELRDIIRALGEEGRAVLVSSHILAEMADFCNSVGIMEQGRMQVSGRIDDILRQMRSARVLNLRLVRPDDRLGDFLTSCGAVQDFQLEGARATLQIVGDDEACSSVLRSLILNDFMVMEFREQAGNLQDIFLKVSSGRAQ